jgi:hypothetical protein
MEVAVLVLLGGTLLLRVIMFILAGFFPAGLIDGHNILSVSVNAEAAKMLVPPLSTKRGHGEMK